MTNLTEILILVYLLAYFYTILATLIDIKNKQTSPFWLLFVFLFPIFGYLIYANAIKKRPTRYFKK